MGPGCVKTREKSSNKKIDLSERPLCDFLEVGKGDPTHENFKFLRFYTAWVGSGRYNRSATGQEHSLMLPPFLLVASQWMCPNFGRRPASRLPSNAILGRAFRAKSAPHFSVSNWLIQTVHFRSSATLAPLDHWGTEVPLCLSGWVLRCR